MDAGSSKVMEAAARKAVKERQIDGQRERQTARHAFAREERKEKLQSMYEVEYLCEIQGGVRER